MVGNPQVFPLIPGALGRQNFAKQGGQRPLRGRRWRGLGRGGHGFYTYLGWEASVNTRGRIGSARKSSVRVSGGQRLSGGVVMPGKDGEEVPPETFALQRLGSARGLVVEIG